VYFICTLSFDSQLKLKKYNAHRKGHSSPDERLRPQAKYYSIKAPFVNGLGWNKRENGKNSKKLLTSRIKERIVSDIKGKDASEDDSDRFCLFQIYTEKGV